MLEAEEPLSGVVFNRVLLTIPGHPPISESLFLVREVDCGASFEARAIGFGFTGLLATKRLALPWAFSAAGSSATDQGMMMSGLASFSDSSIPALSATSAASDDVT